VGVSYKLAAPGHDLGMLSGDMLYGVTGTVGSRPPVTRLTVHARDLDAGRERTSHTLVADEIALGPPLGISPLRITAPLAILDAGDRVLLSEPSQSTARLCVRARVAGHARLLRFCNRYVGDDALGGSGELFASSDVDSAAGLLDAVQIRHPRVRSLRADLTLRRGLAQAYMTKVRAQRRVRRGGTLRVDVDAKVVRGGPRHFRFFVRVPHRLRAGRYRIRLSGRGPDGTGGGDGFELLLANLGGGGGGGGARPGDLGPPSFHALARAFARLHRYDGLTATFVRSGAGSGPRRLRRRVYRNAALRVGGRRAARIRITRP
jgi:hypothetical protein